MRVFTNWWLTPRRLITAYVLRVGLGAMVLLFFGAHWNERAALWGVHGLIDWPTFERSTRGGDHLPWNLYSWSSLPAWSQALYALSILASLAFILGIFPRLAAIALTMLVYSAYERTWTVLDGGHDLMGLLLFYSMFLDMRHDGFFAPKILRRLAALGYTPARPLADLGDSLNVVSHNLGMLLIQTQICMLYLWSVFYKAGGHKWQDGTAIYYVMRVHEFQLPPWSAHIYTNALAVTLLTYSTLIFQASFPFLMWIRRAKPILFIGAIGFHVGIAIFMGLTLFSMTMIVADACLFDDLALRGAAEKLRRSARQSRATLRFLKLLGPRGVTLDGTRAKSLP